MAKQDYRTSRPKGTRRGQIERRLAAVLAADISGYSALMEADEEETHRLVAADITRVMEEAERFQGRVFTFAGDGFLAEFPSSVLALRCAMRIQTGSARRAIRNPDLRNISYRIGIHTGEIMVVGDRTGGNAVNIAARLEQLAEPGGIRISRAVYDQVKGIVPAKYRTARRASFEKHPRPDCSVPCGNWPRPEWWYRCDLARGCRCIGRLPTFSCSASVPHCGRKSRRSIFRGRHG